MKQVQITKQRLLSDDLLTNLMVLLFDDITLKICARTSEGEKQLLERLKFNTFRLFSGKKCIRLTDEFRWYIYAIEDIGKKTKWWSVEWIKKSNVQKEVRFPSSCHWGSLCCRDYKTFKLGSATIQINRDLREELNQKQDRLLLADKYVRRQLMELFPKNLSFQKYLPAGIIRIITIFSLIKNN